MGQHSSNMKKNRGRVCEAGVGVIVILAMFVASPGTCEPPAGEFDGRVERSLRAAIGQGEMAGAVVMATQAGELRCSIAVGDAQTLPGRRPMRIDTVFDLASLTKPVATATAVMRLVQQGKLKLEDPVSVHWPDFALNGKQEITIADLLLHQGGLIADNALSDYDENDPASSWRRIANLKPIAEPGEKFVYSDVGFLVLGRVVERVSGQTLGRYCRDQIFAPLGMTETGYRPAEMLRNRAAASEKRDGKWLVGHVHDPRAARLGGVAGHAGLFSTAADLVRYGEALVDRELATDGPLFRTAIRDRMIEPREVAGGHRRAYGWDIHSSYSSNRPSCFSERAFGHGGFTGTVLWIDPADKRVFVFLSNRLHPDGSGSVNRLASEIADLIPWDTASRPAARP